jgi:hypothetical protein
MQPPTTPRGFRVANPAREPWTVFQNSLAVQFISRRRATWAPETLSPDLEEEVLTALGMRNLIRRRYAEIDSILFDVRRAAGGPSDWPPKQLTRTQEWLADLRALAATPVTVAEDREGILTLATRLAQLSELLALVTHGFVQVREDRAGDVTFHFELGRMRRVFTAVELRAAASKLEAIADNLVAPLKALLRDLA